MNAGKTMTIKEFLRKECLPALAARSPYFSLKDVRAYLAEHSVACGEGLLRVYMSEAMATGAVYDAGRGWYSRLAEPFKLNTKPVAALARRLEKQFPLLEFTCWSTEQIAGYGHHLLAKFVTFVHTDRDAMESVFEHLRDAGFDTYLNPRGQAASQFSTRERTVVVRPKATTQPAEGHLATIEGLLVELFMECRALPFMDVGEFFRTFENLAGSRRILLARLLDYARERRPAGLELAKHIKADFLEKSALLGSKSTR
jgi:hypothetical protein